MSTKDGGQYVLPLHSLSALFRVVGTSLGGKLVHFSGVPRFEAAAKGTPLDHLVANRP